MTRVITSNEIKPDMTIRWETGGITHECVVEAVTPSLASGAVDVDAVGDGYMRIERATLVTVLSEPAPAQPEEPTEFGARVTVSGEKFVRATTSNADPIPWLRHYDGQWCNWDSVLAMGQVTVVPDYGWSAPTDSEAAPEVPERIEEWPEDDEHLWAHRWKDRSGWIWKHHGEGSGGWTARRSDTSATAFTDDSRPCDGPWTIADEERP